MILLAQLVLELIFVVVQIIAELFGTAFWGCFEVFLSKSPFAAGFFIIGLVISVFLFCLMANPLHAAIWSAVEIGALTILGIVFDRN